MSDRRRFHPGPILGLLLFTALFVLPVGWFLLGAFASHASGAISYAAVRNSVLISVAVGLLSVLPGLALAWLSDRRRFPLRSMISPMIWVLFLFPSYLLTTGWQIVMEMPLLRETLWARLFNGIPGIVFLLTMKGLPFAYFASLAAWHMLGNDVFEALALCPLSRQRVARIVGTLLLPAAAAAFVVVFVETIQEFGIPATLGASIHLPIVTYAIYMQLASAPPDFHAAALLSLPLVGLAVMAASAQALIHRRYSVAVQGARSRVMEPSMLAGAARILAPLGIGGLALLGVCLPLGGILYAATGAAVGTAGDVAAWSSLLNSLCYAMLGAGLALAGVFIIWPTLRMRHIWYGQVVNMLTLVNMAIPGVVLGAAYLIVFNGGPLSLYGTPLLLVLAYGAAQVPMLLRLLQAPLSQVHRNLYEAALLHVPDAAARIAEVRLPLMAGPLAWGYGLAFGAIFFELPISELLYPPGRPAFGVSIVSLNQALDYTQAARLGLAAMGILLLLGLGVLNGMRLSHAVTRKFNDVPVAI